MGNSLAEFQIEVSDESLTIKKIVEARVAEVAGIE